ncbi:MAG: precorrin-3B C(17)-methyltransferase [Actinomycetota bacterium]|jgi:cobalt-precorrin 5A hydrolase / precorrin-3B C17-methyltransferase
MSGERIVACSVTGAGAALARRLPYEHRHGGLVATVRERWAEVDGFVLVCATGIAVRAIAPQLADKGSDPAVVVVDDAGRFAIALSGGHEGGANVLAREVAALLGAEPVVTTATDAAGLPALDTLPGFTATGDLAAVTRAWLDGSPPSITVDPALAAWPLPEPLGSAAASARDSAESSVVPAAAATVLVTDRDVAPAPGHVALRPKSLVLGVGSSSGANPEALHRLVVETLANAGLSADAVGCVATVDQKADEPAIVELAATLGVGLRTFPAEVLSGVAVPNPSSVVEAAVGTPSVAEAAALTGAGALPRPGELGAEPVGPALVVEKRRSGEATVAVARRVTPEGHLAVVGLGPGDPKLRTPAAAAAVRQADVVIGYGPYVDLADDLLTARQTVVRSAIGAETERVTEALSRAAGGEQVALVCSGDPGVYAMASLVCELAPQHGHPPVTVVPGVTAALAAAAVLGAPLGHDHAAVSLSDLLTPWPVIERRLRAVADGDFTVSLYNPRSKRRTTQLDRALEILGAQRPPGTPAAIVTDVGRPAQRVVRTTLDDLDPEQVDMLSLVVVGSSTTRWQGGRMVTPRGYLVPAEAAEHAGA